MGSGKDSASQRLYQVILFRGTTPGMRTQDPLNTQGRRLTDLLSVLILLMIQIVHDFFDQQQPYGLWQYSAYSLIQTGFPRGSRYLIIEELAKSLIIWYLDPLGFLHVGRSER